MATVQIKAEKSEFLSFIIAIAVQLISLFIAALVLDMGETLSAVIYLSDAYWIGVGIVYWRRRGWLTAGDHFYLRFGLIPIIVVGVPLFQYVWHIKSST